jgi:copper transport protein
MRLAAALAIILLWLASAGEATAHAALVSVEPANGSILSAAPSGVALQFSEAVTPGAIRLIDSAGRVRDEAKASASGQTISLTMPPDLPQGTSVVSYRVISQDGHPIVGSVIFSIGKPTTTQAPDSSHALLDIMIWLARVALYVGLFAGAGGVFFATWIAGGAEITKLPRAALATGLIGAVASVGLLGLELLDLPPSALLTPAPWKVAMATSNGPAAIIAIISMLLSLIASHKGGQARILSAVAFGGVGMSLAMTGHASTAPPELLTRPAVFVHALAVTFWMGALAPLAGLVATPNGGTLSIVNRFSRIALAAVALLALSGLTLATIQLERFGALVDTDYGLVLSIKLILVVALLGLAALNRLRLTPALARGEGSAPALRRSILLECGIGLCVFGLVAGWRFTPPPRTIIPDTPLAIHMHSERAMFQVLVSPGKAGRDDVVLQLMTGEATPLEAKEVQMTLGLPERGIEPIDYDAVRGPDGYWHVRHVDLPFAGRWHVRIDALVTDFDKITLEDDLEIAPK